MTGGNSKSGYRNSKSGNKKSREAAVLLASAGVGREQSILLTRRSAQMRSHSGEVALPGGMREEQDTSLEQTALREAEEEVGLRPDTVHIAAQMSVRFTRQGTAVTPFVARVPVGLELTPCDYELESLFWLPQAWLLGDPRERTDIFVVNGKEFWAPVFRFQQYKIWGFTARLLVDYLNIYYGANIQRKHTAQEVVFKAQG